MSLTFTSTDLDNAASETGVVHQDTANTDHNDANTVKQGYSIQSPYLASNLVGYWPLQENSGGTANDFSGRGNDGIVNGPTQGENGILGTTSYGFDGVDDGVDIGTSIVSGQNLSNFTVAGWAINEDTSNNRRIFAEGNGSGLAWTLYHSNGGPYGLVLRQSDGSSATARVSGTITENQWIYWTATGNASDGTVTFYTDGNQVASGSWDGTYSRGADMVVGYDNTNNDNYWQGNLWGLRVYDTDLSSSQVQSLYNVVNTAGELITQSKTS